MRTRVVLISSLGLNAVLLGVLLVGHPRSAPPASESASSTPEAVATVRTNVVLRKQFFTWSELESEDYPTYIANLRTIGCPEETIKDIIVADVDDLFAEQRAAIVSAAQPLWWEPAPDEAKVQQAAAALQALNEERNSLLEELLGADWSTVPTVTTSEEPPAIPLDGPILGRLTDEQKQAVREVCTAIQERFDATLRSARVRGQPPSPQELARLYSDARQQLASVLPPAELEEFQLKYSPIARDLRSSFDDLRFFGVSESEFRAAFRAIEPIELQLMGLDPINPTHTKQIDILTAQRDNALRNAIGPTRYEEYLRLRDPGYRAAVAKAAANGKPEASRELYTMSEIARGEAQKISTDASLTDLQREVQLKQLELEQAQAAAEILGQASPSEPPAPVPPRRQHRIQAGDSLQALALRYRTTIPALLRANPRLENPSQFQVGDQIIIPAP